jgi:replicative superfamily II helicase
VDDVFKRHPRIETFRFHNLPNALAACSIVATIESTRADYVSSTTRSTLIASGLATMDELTSVGEESSTTKEIQRVRERLLLIRRNMEGELDGDGSFSDTYSSSSSSTSSSSSSSDDIKHSGSTGVVLNETTNTTGLGAELGDSWEAAPSNLPHTSNPVKSTIPRVEVVNAAHNALDMRYGQNGSHCARSNPLAVKVIARTPVGISATTSKTVASTSAPTENSRYQLTQPANPGSNEHGEGGGYKFTMNEGTTMAGKRKLEVSRDSSNLSTSIATRSGASRSELEEGTLNTNCASHDDDGHICKSRLELEDGTTTRTCASKEYNLMDEHTLKSSTEQFAFQQSDCVPASQSRAQCEHEHSIGESDKRSDESSSTSSSSSNSSSSSSSESNASQGGYRRLVPVSFDSALHGRTNNDATPKNATQLIIPRSTAHHNSASKVPFYNPYKKSSNKSPPLSDATEKCCDTPCPQRSNPGAFKTLTTETPQPSPEAAQDNGGGKSDEGSNESSSTSSSSSDSSSSSSSDSNASQGGFGLVVPASFDAALPGRTNNDATPKNATQSMIPAHHNSASKVPFYNPYKKPPNKGPLLSDSTETGPCPQGSNPGAFKTMSTDTSQPSPEAAQDQGGSFPFFADDDESSPTIESPDAIRGTSTSWFFRADSQTESPPVDSRVVKTAADQFLSDYHNIRKQSSSKRPVRHDALRSLAQLDNVLHEDDAASVSTASSNVPPSIRTLFPCHDYGLEVEVLPEVDPASHALPTHYNKKPPVVHRFSFRNRPPHARQKIPIPELFTWPANLMWRSKFQAFNAFQSEMANHLCHSDDNIVVSAPTGAGKTTVFEMAIARFVTTDYNNTRNNQHSNTPHLSKHRKIVYIAPSKALCEERYEDWSKRFAEMNMGITVAMITGDGEAGQSFHDFASAHFILTTPEKFDGMSRRWTESFFLMASVKLFLLDEVHVLGDKSRGCCLESIVVRVKTIQRVARNIQASSEDIPTSRYVDAIELRRKAPTTEGSHHKLLSYPDTTQQAISSCMRIVAVSATLPNIGDVAQFLDANEAYSFDESYRPVPLATHVVDCGNSGKNQFMFWNALDKRVSEQIRKYSDGKQTLIFCHTKKETEKLAQLLGGPSTNPGNPPTLQDWISSGVGYHHAGLQQFERKLVEEAFEEGKLRCLCATSSLAVGVNLPARLVIVKGTKTYRGGGSGYQDVDTAQLLQMVGRAGRPGLDTRGTAVILTDAQSKAHVEYLLQGFDPAESHLNSRLVEILNTEVSQGVITSVDDAVKWLSSTFFYVRLQKDPRVYGSHENSNHSTEAYLEKIVRQSFEQLQEIGAVPADYGRSVYPLSASHIMSHHLTSFSAMKAIAMLPFDATECQILNCLSQMEAIQYPLRRHEKKLLNECHQEVRFKLATPSNKFKIQSMSEKAFVLLQACIGQQYFNDFTLRQEMTSMTEQCSAILTAAQEFSTRGSKNGYVALQCYKLKRSLYASLWGEASGVLNQLAGLGQKYTRILSMNGISTFADVMSSSDEAIAKACGQGVSFGNDLRAKVSQLLSDKLNISAVMEYGAGTDSPIGVVCSVSHDKDMPNHVSQRRSSGLKYILVSSLRVKTCR